MGFSFSGIREELDSKELGKLYRRLQADCRYLAPFADWKAIVAFLHEKKRAYRRKDRILWRLIQYYRQGGDCERLGAVFLAIFEPAILGLYSFWRSRYPYLGNDDLFHGRHIASRKKIYCHEGVRRCRCRKLFADGLQKVTGDCHVRIRGSVGVKFPLATRLIDVISS